MPTDPPESEHVTRPASLWTLIETIRRQLAEIEADLRALYDDYFVETGATSVQFGDAASGARLPTGVENVRAQYRSGLGDSGNQPADLALTLLELLARAADRLAKMQDRVAEEAYLGPARTRRSRHARLMDFALGAMVGIAAWQAVCSISRRRRATRLEGRGDR